MTIIIAVGASLALINTVVAELYTAVSGLGGSLATASLAGARPQ